jgi:OOP family OmpA-OmpF porin
MNNSIFSKSAILGLSALVLSLSSYSAYAVGPGGYGGIAIGSASYSDDELVGLCGDFGLDCTSSTSDTAFKLFGGYQFNPYFSLEAGYADWGKVSVKPISGTGLSFESKGPYLALMPGIPIGDNFTIFGELGVAYLDANLKGTVPVIGEVARVSDSLTAPIYGFGADLHLEEVSFRFLWERIDPDETYTVEGVNVSTPILDLYTLAVIFRF